MLDKLAVVVVVSWLNQQLVPRRQRPRLKSNERTRTGGDVGLIRYEVTKPFSHHHQNAMNLNQKSITALYFFSSGISTAEDSFSISL